MNIEYPAKKKHWWSDDNDSTADEHEDDRPKQEVVRREVKHLRRITKRGEKALGHMSEALERERVTEKDLDITKEVLGGITKTPNQEPPKAATPTVPLFGCFECGARIPRDSVRCPECGILYVQDPKDEALDVSFAAKEQTLADGEGRAVFADRSMSFAHFDIKSGMMTCLQTDGEETDFGLECHNCGALTQFGTDKCPLCHHSFDEWDTGLIGLLDGLKFDLDEDKELNCPMCGEHVVVDGGRCPSCKETITYRSKNSPDAVVQPLLKEKDVIFVHLDVVNDDLWFATKVRPRKVNDTQSYHLDSISKPGFEHEWKSLARI